MRADLIEIYEARFELKFCQASEKAQRLEIYNRLVREAAEKYKCSAYEFKCAIDEDYKKWVREGKRTSI